MHFSLQEIRYERIRKVLGFTDQAYRFDKDVTVLTGTALTAQPVVAARNTGCSEAALSTMPEPSTQWTSMWSNTVPSSASYSVGGEAALNVLPDTNSTWTAADPGTLPAFHGESWNTICGELEIRAIPDSDLLWPIESTVPALPSQNDWGALSGEVEISMMEDTRMSWIPGSAM